MVFRMESGEGPFAQPSSSDTPAPSNPWTYRLLYRGGLSLPDSHLTLDGLAFLLRRPASLEKMELDNPLALALETLRGRPTLRFLGTAKVKDLWLDEGPSGDVLMYIHPDSFLTTVYFENILCLQPELSDDGRTEDGVRIGLGDDHSEILVYGQRQQMPTSSPSSLLTLCVSRILPGPRPPRPDDPTPRKPPKCLLLSEADGGQNKRRKERGEDEAVRRAREIMLRGPKAGPSKLPPSKPGPNNAKSSDATFKVPNVPAGSRAAADPKGKAKGKGKEAPKGEGSMSEVEKANKTLVKTLTVSHLSFAGMAKGHPEFKDVFEWIYRGVGFALRAQMKTRPVDPGLVDKYVRAHAEMYIVADSAAGNVQTPRTLQ